MAYEEKYIKLLEERVEELQQQLANEQKRTTPVMSADELVVKFLAYSLEFNAGQKVPANYRFTDERCAAKSYTNAKIIRDILKGKISINTKYLDIVTDAMKKLEAE